MAVSNTDINSKSNGEDIQLRADNLAVEAGPLRLFEHLSFELKAGQGLVLRGPNGSGKTSLLRAIAGLYPLAAGRIEFGNISAPNDYSIAGNCHFLGHKNGLKHEQSVRQNLMFFTRFQGGHKTELMTAARALNLTALLDLPVAVLSAGQKRRAAFARLTLSPRPLWLLDEPTAALDISSAKQVETLCKTHLDGGGLLIASSHLPFLEELSRMKTLSLSQRNNNADIQNS